MESGIASGPGVALESGVALGSDGVMESGGVTVSENAASFADAMGGEGATV